MANPAPANLSTRLAQSRRRSLERHRLDARSRGTENVLSGSQLSRIRERNEALLRVAVPGVDWLHRQLGDLGYCLLLTDATGATLEVRATGQRASQFTSAGLRAGACWSEDTQGTCGVGTALADGEPVLVHGDQHFLVRNHGISCTAVPLFGPEQQLLGVLNATACTQDAQKLGLSLAYRLTLQTAARIEQSVFMSHFADHWVVRVTQQHNDWDASPADLIAFDEGGRVLGVSRQLKQRLGNDAYFVDEILHHSVSGLVEFARTHPGTPMSLEMDGKNTLLSALISAPRKVPGHRSMLAAGRPAARANADNAEMGIEGEHRLELLVNGKVPILLLGETGSGKEYTAKKIHSRSQRRDQPFVAINCAAIPETLIESELFGYRGGAFTGALAKGCVGKIAQADGGTLFLDEIGDMPLALQTRLLRVLAEGEVLALGASKPQVVDISVICATHRDLGAMVREGRFREDLYYRLNAATVKLPPLRERKDIADLIRSVFSEECKTVGRHLSMSAEVLAGLVEHAWPGNIRELRNVLRYAIAVCPQAEMSWAHLPESFQSEALNEVADRRRAQLRGHVVTGQASERELILDALKRTNGCVSAASRFLGISRSTLYRRLSEHGVDVTFRPGQSNTASS